MENTEVICRDCGAGCGTMATQDGLCARCRSARRDHAKAVDAERQRLEQVVSDRARHWYEAFLRDDKIDVTQRALLDAVKDLIDFETDNNLTQT